MFFLMLLSLGLGTQFSIMETITRIVVDALHGRASHRTVLACSCCLMLLGGLSMVTQGGMYVLQLMDSHAGTFSALVTGLVEVLAISWLYGVDRFLEDIRRMIGWTGQEPFYRLHRLYWSTIWKVVTPTLLLVILVASAAEYRPMTYGAVTYPGWANGLGWLVSGVSVLCIPAVMLAKCWSSGGWRVISNEDRWGELTQPTKDWGQAERDFRRRETGATSFFLFFFYPTWPSSLALPLQSSGRRRWS
jgi:solute carrier family 6 amino acid transporter-like protein 5/7/9/14